MEKKIANSDGGTDHRTELRRVQFLSEYVLQCIIGTLTDPGETFSKNPPNIFF